MPTVLPITTCVPGDHTVDHTTMLTDVLKLHFGWNLARIKCLSCLIIALFKVKTVNFAELATAFSGSAKPDSHYRRIQRFFKEVKIQQDMVAQLVASFLPYDQFILSMDRTNWMLGCFSINFLVLSIVVRVRMCHEPADKYFAIGRSRPSELPPSFPVTDAVPSYRFRPARHEPSP